MPMTLWLLSNVDEVNREGEYMLETDVANESSLFSFNFFQQFCWNSFIACIKKLQYFIMKCTSGQKSTDHSTSYIGWENFDSSDLESVTTTTNEQPRSRPVFLHTKKRGYLATSLAGHRSSHQVSIPLFL